MDSYGNYKVSHLGHRILEPSVTYFGILADFQDSGASVRKPCFHLLIFSKIFLNRSALLSDHSQTSRIIFRVFDIFITFCVDRWQHKMLKVLKH